MPTTVLDSHALLAYFWDDLGGEKVENLLTKAALSNRPLHMTELAYMEVKSILLRRGGQTAWQKAAEVMMGLPIEFHPGSRQLAEIAAELKARHQISVCNAFTGALAQDRKAEIAAGDVGLAVLESEIKIVWISPK